MILQLGYLTGLGACAILEWVARSLPAIRTRGLLCRLVGGGVLGWGALQVEEGFAGLEVCGHQWVGGREVMSVTHGGRGVVELPGRFVVSYRGGYSVVLVGRVLGWAFSLRVGGRLLRFEGLAMAGFYLVVGPAGGAVGRVGAREVLRYEQGSGGDVLLGPVHVLIVMERVRSGGIHVPLG